MDSDIARSSNNIQRIELKPNTQLSSTGKLVTRWRKESLERTKFDLDTPNQEKHDEVTKIQRVRGNPYSDTNPQNVAFDPDML